MVGTGVFTSLGYQLQEINSPYVVLLQWLTGGIFALSGALCYSELAANLPRSGGEYHFLSKIYHPFLGFLAGWISILVGFSAPTALAAMAMAGYTGSIFNTGHTRIMAIAIIIMISFIHSFQIKFESKFQLGVTKLKILIILGIIFSGLAFVKPVTINLIPHISDFNLILSPGFAVSMIFVFYSFSGWNAAVYITDEIKDPDKTIPGSLFMGTLLVTLMYFLLNFIFLYTTPLGEMNGKIDVGFIAAVHIFGREGGMIMGSMIALLLVSTLSSMIWIGPRVSMVMGEDYRIIKFLSKTNRYHVPVTAVWAQAVVSIIMILSSTFDKVLIYAGFTLNIFTLLSVVGVFIMRIKIPRQSGKSRLPGYPLTPVIFIILNLWMLIYLIFERPVESLIGMFTVMTGGILYYIEMRRMKPESSD